jgi:hypothetical protein
MLANSVMFSLMDGRQLPSSESHAVGPFRQVGKKAPVPHGERRVSVRSSNCSAGSGNSLNPRAFNASKARGRVNLYLMLKQPTTQAP